jgi:hypothetical protein
VTIFLICRDGEPVEAKFTRGAAEAQLEVLRPKSAYRAQALPDYWMGLSEYDISHWNIKEMEVTA